METLEKTRTPEIIQQEIDGLEGDMGMAATVGQKVDGFKEKIQALQEELKGFGGQEASPESVDERTPEQQEAARIIEEKFNNPGERFLAKQNERAQAELKELLMAILKILQEMKTAKPETIPGLQAILNSLNKKKENIETGLKLHEERDRKLTEGDLEKTA